MDKLYYRGVNRVSVGSTLLLKNDDLSQILRDNLVPKPVHPLRYWDSSGRWRGGKALWYRTSTQWIPFQMYRYSEGQWMPVKLDRG